MARPGTERHAGRRAEGQGDRVVRHGKSSADSWAWRCARPQEQRQSGAEGLLIEQSAGPAAKAGIQPGDVLLSLNGVPVRDIEQVKAELAKAGKTVALLVQRGDDKIFVPVRIG